MKWADLTWSEIPDVLARCGQAAILPVGATEQHGPHLGCGVDFVIAEQLCAAVAAQTGVPMLPTLPYGCSLGHSRRWPGTIALQPVTLIQLVKEIGDWAYHGGIRRLFIVNAHVTNAAPLRCALEMLRA
jgi:creatinine amidohydrolase